MTEARCPACYEVVDFHEVLDGDRCPECGIPLDRLNRIADIEESRRRPNDGERYPVQG